MHELYHLKSDKSYNKDENVDLKLEGYHFSYIPEEVRSYYKKINIYSDSEIYEFVKREKLFDPIKYQNEIKAYEHELSLGYNISQDYRNEIKAKIWQYKEYINMINYSNNQH